MCKIVITTLLSLYFSFSAFGMKVFDMKEIRDPSTLQIKVLQDWHQVNGVIETRQKLVTINVGDLWPGQEYRILVRMVVPANRKAKGFHLTGGSSHPVWKRMQGPTPTSVSFWRAELASSLPWCRNREPMGNEHYPRLQRRGLGDP